MNLTTAAIRLADLPQPVRLDAAARLLADFDGRDFDAGAAAVLFEALQGGTPDHAATAAWLDGFRSSPTAAYLRARYCGITRDKAAAAACWREFLSLAPCRDPLTLLQAARAFAAIGEWDLSAARVRDALAARPDYTFHVRAQGFVRQVAQHAPARLRRARIAVLGSATTSLLIPVLELLCFRDRVEATFYEGLFGAYRQEILDPSSGLYRFAPDIVFIIPHWRDLNLPSLASDDAAAASVVSEHVKLWETLASRAGCLIVQHAFDLPEAESAGSLAGRSRGGRHRVIREINLRLEELAPAGVAVLDTERVVAEAGLPVWHDTALWHRARQVPSPRALPVLAEEQAAYIRAALGLTRKVVVCDLDNTLWGGVVGEDGAAGIRIGGASPEGEAFAELQQHLKDLRARGILLAVASKNNPDDARQPFAETPGMVLKLDDFAAFEANWDDKVTTIRRIAQELSLGLDTFVFLDDNPLERAWVRSQLPDVAVVELSGSPASYVRELAAGKYFDVLDISEEDRRRADMYRQSADHQALRAQAASLEEFLGGLHMRAGVQPICDGNLKRVAQLINKTNQFNLTTRRYTEAQVRHFATLPGWSGVFDLSDRFGGHGIVGVMICVPAKPTDAWEIDTWLMSCRVLGRQLERLMLDCAIAAARDQGVHRLVGVYRPTEKNALVADLFASLGFARLPDVNGDARYELDLTTPAGRYSTFIDLVPSSESAGVPAAHEA